MTQPVEGFGSVPDATVVTDQRPKPTHTDAVAQARAEQAAAEAKVQKLQAHLAGAEAAEAAASAALDAAIAAQEEANTDGLG